MTTGGRSAPTRMTDTERRLGRNARRQLGLITNEQLEAAGVSVDTKKRWVRAGRLIAIAPGVVAVAGTAATWRQRTLAAVLAAGPGAVASHTTAAALYGLSGCPFRSVEITVPRGRSHRSRLATVHEARRLDRCDVTTVDRIPVTHPARTLVDLAGRVSRAALEDAVDDALVHRLTTLARLRVRLEALGGSGRQGSVLLRTVLATWDTGELPEEVAEARLLRRLLAADLPVPVVQHEICDPSGRVVARADLAYPDARVAVELDGFRWHGTPRGHARDQARARRLAALGWLVVPATPLDLAGPGDELARHVAAAMAHAPAARKGA
jgi:hypothetical protein